MVSSVHRESKVQLSPTLSCGVSEARGRGNEEGDGDETGGFCCLNVEEKRGVVRSGSNQDSE